MIIVDNSDVRTLARIFILILTIVPVCPANLIVSYSASGVQTSSAANASTYTFDALSSGLNSSVSWAGIGTFDKVWAQASDQYGGAGGTGKYAATGAEASSASLLSTTLTLTTPEAYLGLWISAADTQNLLTLYQGTTTLGTFNVTTLVNALGACGGANAFCGNPNSGQDSGEQFAYLNFFGTSGTTITKVVFSNANTSTGFEFDNIAVSTAPGAVTGTTIATIISTPEPTTIALLVGGLLGLIWVSRSASISRSRIV